MPTSRDDSNRVDNVNYGGFSVAASTHSTLAGKERTLEVLGFSPFISDTGRLVPSASVQRSS